MVTLLVTSNSPLVSRMVPVTPDASIVSPLAALARAARSVPGPLSAVLVTLIVSARLVHGPRAAAVAQSNNSRAPTTATDVNLVIIGRFAFFVFIVLRFLGDELYCCDLGIHLVTAHSRSNGHKESEKKMELSEQPRMQNP
jgi:hypothetical protein